MKNQITHDSIHRVEPSARVLAEQRGKVEADLQAVQRSLDEEHLEKESKPVESGETDAAENDKGGNSPGREYQKSLRQQHHQEEPKPRLHHLGGQLFDSDA